MWGGSGALPHEETVAIMPGTHSSYQILPTLLKVATFCITEPLAMYFHLPHTAVDESGWQPKSCATQAAHEGNTRLTKGRAQSLLLPAHPFLHLRPECIIAHMQLRRSLWHLKDFDARSALAAMVRLVLNPEGSLSSSSLKVLRPGYSR